MLRKKSRKISGHTNDGNTNWRFFADPNLAAEIGRVDINLNLVKVMLKTISRGHKIDTDRVIFMAP